MFIRMGIVFLIILAGLLLQVPVAGSISQGADEMQNFRPIKHSKVISKLVKCESSGRNIKIVDSNGYYSYGILQYQKRTWNWFNEMSGIKGDPMNPVDAIIMTDWAIENGLGDNWSCWKKIK